MSTSGDEFINREDIVGYLEETDPQKDDPELDQIYDRINHHYQEYLMGEEKGKSREWDLAMAKYWLSQAWIVEGERQKEGYS